MVLFCVLFVGLLTQTSALLAPPKLKFTSCLAPHEHATEYGVIDGIYLDPDPVVLPGNLTVGGHALFKKNITGSGFRMNVSIYKVLLGQKTLVPCVSNVGSCSYDLCDDLMGYTNGSVIHDCDTTELAGLGLPCKCPIPAGSYTLPRHLFQVPKIASLWSFLASGEYHVHVEFIDTNAGNLRAACFDIDISLRNTNSGFLFG